MKLRLNTISLMAMALLMSGPLFASQPTGGEEPTCVILDEGGIDETDFAVKAYPSPFINELHLENPGEESVTVRVLNVLGKEVARMELQTGEKATLNTIDLPKGMFFVQTVIGDRQHTMRLFKVNQ